MLYNINKIKNSNKKGLNNLSNILIKSNNLDNKQLKQLFSSEINVSTSNSKCVLNAIKRIKQAKENKEKVFVFGDYDADGICATTIMKDTLDKLEIENGYYIPDRFKEGYGINEDKVKLAYEKGYKLIITVDNGVKAHHVIKLVKQLNMDIIITDHHLIDEEIDTDIVVHPDYMEEKFKQMCGSGVALQLSRNLIGNNDYHTTLAMIATIADVMPLWNENRNIVKHGLRIINEKKIKILDDLLENKNDITSMDISFTLVPKLNSVGRLSDINNVNDIIRYYFLCDDNSISSSMLNKINYLNTRRKEISNKMLEKSNKLLNNDNFIIVDSDDFHEGIVGIVAGRLSSKYNKPAIVLSKDEDKLKGSGRSIKSFDLHKFLNELEFNYLSFGGHNQAVGLSIKKEDYEEFKNKVKNNYSYTNEEKQEVYLIDTNDITIENINEMFYLQPFGEGFKMPQFLIESFSIKNYILIKNMYPKYKINDFEAICFEKDYNIKKPNKIIGNFSINKYKNKETISMIIKHIE